MRIAGIGGDEFTVLCFAWVGRIVEPRRKGLQRGFAFADVHGDNSSDSDRQDSFLKNQMGANGILAVDVVYSNQFNKSEFAEARHDHSSGQNKSFRSGYGTFYILEKISLLLLFCQLHRAAHTRTTTGVSRKKNECRQQDFYACRGNANRNSLGY